MTKLDEIRKRRADLKRENRRGWEDCDYLFALDTIEQDCDALLEMVDRLVHMMRAGGCPFCDGSGGIEIERTGCEPGCCGRPLPTGECCGEAVPVPVPILEYEQCGW